MTHEEKELLLQDLCARLPYGVIIECGTDYDFKNDITDTCKLLSVNIDNELCGIQTLDKNRYVFNESLDTIKPYLRPMSSMTQEEMDNFQQCLNIIENENYGDGWSPAAWGQMAAFIHYCNEHHLDYNGLIAMGLALEAPKEMYND